MLGRNYLYGIVLIFALVHVIIGCAESGEARALRCDMCGMDVEKSETKYRLTLKGGAARNHACSFSCANMLEEKLGAGVSAVETTDRITAGFVNIRAATFVVESDVVPKGSMPPWVLAFSKKEDAVQFATEHKGRVLGLEGVRKLMTGER